MFQAMWRWFWWSGGSGSAPVAVAASQCISAGYSEEKLVAKYRENSIGADCGANLSIAAAYREHSIGAEYGVNSIAVTSSGCRC